MTLVIERSQESSAKVDASFRFQTSLLTLLSKSAPGQFSRSCKFLACRHLGRGDGVVVPGLRRVFRCFRLDPGSL